MARPTDPISGEATHPLHRSSESTARLSLLVVAQRVGTSYELPPFGEITLGRSELCDIVIPDSSISRKHLTVEVGPPLRVRDHGSVNGVTLRGRRLDPREVIEIEPGEVIELGSVTIVVQRGVGGEAAHVDQENHVRSSQPTALGARDSNDEPVIALDPAMRAVFDLVARVSSGSISVLVVGETGVGKEIVAEALHRKSPRAGQRFLRLNCATLSPTLLESELFGHEKGAFTGALAAKPGLLEAADGGTVFLDEVGELPMALQVKLLRVLEERAVLRVGALSPRPIDVRFVAATNRDLRAEVANGSFRQDLYYRLNGITIAVPPLRERTTEIDSLAQLFAARAARALSRPTPVLSAEALALLQSYTWPGNVRELRNVIDRAVLLCTGTTIEIESLPSEITQGSPSPERVSPPSVPTAPAGPAIPVPPLQPGKLTTDMDAFERRRIVDALAQCGGNQTRAAELLGVSRRTLVNKLRQHAIRPTRSRGGEKE